MPKKIALGLSNTFTDSDYVNEYFPDLYRDFKHISAVHHPFMYFNFTYYGRSVAVRKIKTGYQCVTRCWYSVRFADSLLKRSKRTEWHIYYHGNDIINAVRWYFRLVRELLLMDCFDVDSFYLPTQMEFF